MVYHQERDHGEAMQKLNVRISLGHVTSNREPEHYSVLEVVDASSRRTIVQVELTPEQVYNLMISRQIEVDGVPALVADAAEAVNLGKEINTFARTFQHTSAIIRNWPDGDPAKSPELIEFAEQLQAKTWCHAYRWSGRNNGVNLTLWRYENGLTDTSKAAIHAATPPKGLK
jgi:hypothetical protein